MDIVLERILSLIPKKENGDFKHGAKSDFARAIGYKDGHIIAMWENGSSDTYRNKLADIALACDVSLEWLKGETDDPTPPGQILTPDEKLERLFMSMDREQLLSAISRATELLRDK